MEQCGEQVRKASKTGLSRPRLVIGGTNSGVGKTTFTLGLMAALRKRGLRVQGFKVGPDYIDPTYHSAVTGRVSRNLDTWMASADVMREVFLRGSADADVSIIEGVMGLYDGQDPLSDRGSTAEVAQLLGAPTILILNISALARSAAAIVKGFMTLSAGVPIAGVICNQAGSQGHIELVRKAVEQECGVPVLGGFVQVDGIEMPERHLGLIPAVERGDLQPLFERLAEEVEAALDLERLLEIAKSAPELPASETSLFAKGEVGRASSASVRIAVARDAAFNFYYRENLELLEQLGAELVFFSPLTGEKVPEDACGLYIGGGFPEEFAKALSRQADVREDLRARIADGLPTVAECGGYMYLAESITDRHGQRYEMVGVVPGQVRMQERLVALGYREVVAAEGAEHEHFLLKRGETARGHEFHYSTMESAGELASAAAYRSRGYFGEMVDGYRLENLVAGYTHLYFPSQPEVPRRFVEKARQYREVRRCGREKV
ncbi:MAG TPA: cobyrinate a,c-diamide synthase [Bacilli bacterium]|nr:cobyrinate a,c-diamide synthase [Bacilli bacterium]